MEWFRHDINMEIDEGVANLMLDYRLEGLGAYIHTLHILYNNNGRIQKQKLLKNLRKLTKNGEPIYQALLDEGLIQEDGEDVTSNRVVTEIAYREESKKKRSEAGKRGMQSRWKKEFDNNVITKDNTLPDLHLDSYISKSIRLPRDNHIQGRIPKGGQESSDNDVITKDNDVINQQGNFEPFTVPFSEIQEYWNNTAGKAGLPKCTVMSDKRRKAVKACFTAPGLGLELIYKACDLVAESDFLTGRNNGWGGCSFDWLFITNNMIKVLEGNYSNGRGSGSSRRNVPTDLNGQYQNDEGTEVTEL